MKQKTFTCAGCGKKSPMPSIDWQSCKPGKTSRYCNDCDLLLIQDQPTALVLEQQRIASITSKARQIIPLISDFPEGEVRDRFIAELAKQLRLRKCNFDTHETLHLILFGNGAAPGLTTEVVEKAIRATSR